MDTAMTPELTLPEAAQSPAVLAGPAGILSSVREIATRELAPQVQAIDHDGLYPEETIRAFGEAGAYRSHLPGLDGQVPDLVTSIEAMAIAGEHCLSTSFCMWCQDALGWYIFNSENTALRDELGPGVAVGEILGGTGLSNPMKSFYGIEKLKLKAERVEGGYAVTGVLPWVSNLGDDHYLGIVFAVPGDGDKKVMAVADCSGEGVRIVQNEHFVALEGTRTFAVQFRKAFIPDSRVLADPIDDYLPKIRAGFILLQAGMTTGMIRGCIDLMMQMRQPLGHVNCYLPDQPEAFSETLAEMQETVAKLAATPFEPGKDYLVEVIRARLAAGEVAVQAAHNAMLHCGARGYVSEGAAQRRLREAYFCAIVTPATKQLRKMLADLGAA